MAAAQKRGKDHFYHDVLLVLFFEGLAHQEAERSPASKALLGKIPYLNGGLFLPHQIERAYGEAIRIADAVFDRIFTFFDKYTWHLDDRPLRADNEINPDVLGYIFEKYINQKQMGAYYTKEDITGYICRNTILPFLLDKLAGKRPAAFDPLPMADVEPYIYDAVKTTDYLPTETEREYAARTERLAALRQAFAEGRIAAVNDLITYNLDIERFTQQWLADLQDPVTLQAFYFECLKKLTVLDPTVGSGAFLFAAMNILEPLYELCLDKMAEWLADQQRRYPTLKDRRADGRYRAFDDELASVSSHPNRRYFIYKSIIVHNLFGVDIMEEATEICKLRLFLRLVAQVDDANRIEPLPDIDFNIRAGNTLVGYTRVEEVQNPRSLLVTDDLVQKVNTATRELGYYREMQTRLHTEPGEMAAAKAKTQALLREVDTALNEALFAEYGGRDLNEFVTSHHPMHWYVEFNTIMEDGGFDVIVGNPPYVEYSKVRSEYRIRGYQTEVCGNLYAFCIERCEAMLKPSGWLGLVVQQPIVSTQRMQAVRTVLVEKSSVFLVSTYDDRPSKLFDGMHHARIALVLSKKVEHSGHTDLYVTRYNKWYKQERPWLFSRLQYVRSDVHQLIGVFPKIGSTLEEDLVMKLLANSRQLVASIAAHQTPYNI